MGSSSSNKQYQETTNTTDTTNTNIQDNTGLAFGTIKGSTVNLTTTDQGSVAKAFDTTNQALTFAQKASKNALDFAFNAGKPGVAMSKNMLYAGAGLVSFSIMAYTLSQRGKK